MRISANTRIQWLHDELTRNTYPNAMCLAERFHISRRQAQRDIDYLRKQLGAPIVYAPHHQGYRYTATFSLPLIITGENDETLVHVAENPFAAHPTSGILEADYVIVQTQIPYTATLEINDKLTVMEMRSYIISDEDHDRYLCEFHNIDRFLCAILIARSGIRILEPDWLRDKLLHMANKVIRFNHDTN